MRPLHCFWLGLLAPLAWCVSIPFAQPTAPPQILRYVEGVDQSPQPMAASDIAAQLNDPWATLVLRQGNFPTNLDKALAALDQLTAEMAFSKQASFFVSESGHIPIDSNTATLKREFRMVITRAKPNASSPSILISAPAGPREDFIELMSWDPTKKAFNFYRRTTGVEWVWKGDTRDAFRVEARGKGCFLCHSHGVPVMKELRVPWNNWHSMSASIPPEAIPSEEIRTSSLFTDKSGAEQLEKVVRGWIFQATKARVADLMQGDTLADAPALLRPLFATTTVNLTSSAQTSDGNAPTLNLPPTFFLNVDALSHVLDLDILLGSNPTMRRNFYRVSLDRFAFRLQAGAFSRKGDTHFAFFVPEPAREEVEAIKQLIVQQVITPHFATSILMVDFPNPVFSPVRSHLLQYVPQTGRIENGQSDVSERTATAILQAASILPDDSPEKQFAAYWNLPPDQLRTESKNRITNYWNAVRSRLETQTGVEDYTRLADSRRRQFGNSPLSESPLLLPQTNIPANPLLHMKADGSVGP